ncbi:MAG: type II secretion system secretin GspD [Gammaproteobacteria bacterium]|nr:type II secretion system secretin GspD [Gammaproteobacteria bacterium]
MNNKFNLNQIFKAFCAYAVLFTFTVAFTFNVVSAETGVTLNLKDADIRSFIETVAEATERNFVVDPRVKAKVTVVSARSMNREEVYQVFLSVLQVHGYAAVQVGEIIKILPDVNAKQGPVVTGNGSIKSTGDELVTRVIPIKNVPAAQMVPILRPLVPQQGHLAAYPNSNVLVISDRAANIQRLISIINRIDRPDSQEIEVVPLEHASAAEVVRIINSMSRQDAQGQVPGGTTLAADERSNSILLSGDNAARLRIRGLIAHLDTPLQGGGNSQVVFLKYAKAAELAPILLGVTQFEAEGQQGNASGTATGANLQDVDIQADETTNALIITAAPAKFESIRRIISQLDIRRAQVLVEAIIAEVSTGLSRELGVQFAYVPTERSSGTTPAVGELFTNSQANIAGLIAGGSDAALTAVTSGFFVGAAKLSGKDRFAALLRALEGDSATNILSTPQLMTLDNEEAEIVVAQNVPFITGQFTNTGSGTDSAVNPFQTIEREDVGITLRITPQINEGDSVILAVETESSSLSPSPVASDLITNKRSIVTTVLAKDQQTIVMGGLIEDEFTDDVQKVPLLGDIPLLGNLFKSTSTRKDKQNLMVFIHPVIVRDAATSTYATNAKYSFMKARQIEAEIDDRGLIKNGARRLPDLDELVTQLPGGAVTSTSPVSVDQLLQQSPGIETTAIEELGDIQVNDIPVDEIQTENISIPTDSDVIILE